MPRTILTPEVAPGSQPLAENVLTFTAADVANGNRFAHTGKEVVLVRNANAGSTAREVTFQSVAIRGRQDAKHNTGQSVPAAQVRVYGPFDDGWRQSDGYVYCNGDNAELQFCVLRYP